jgi:hypothetical protein
MDAAGQSARAGAVAPAAGPGGGVKAAGGWRLERLLLEGGPLANRLQQLVDLRPRRPPGRRDGGKAQTKQQGRGAARQPPQKGIQRHFDFGGLRRARSPQDGRQLFGQQRRVAADGALLVVLPKVEITRPKTDLRRLQERAFGPVGVVQHLVQALNIARRQTVVGVGDLNEQQEQQQCGPIGHRRRALDRVKHLL